MSSPVLYYIEPLVWFKFDVGMWLSLEQHSLINKQTERSVICWSDGPFRTFKMIPANEGNQSSGSVVSRLPAIYVFCQYDVMVMFLESHHIRSCVFEPRDVPLFI